MKLVPCQGQKLFPLLLLFPLKFLTQRTSHIATPATRTLTRKLRKALRTRMLLEKIAGLPQDSPIWPTIRNQLDQTKFSLSELHSNLTAPLEYRSSVTKKICNLMSANVLYLGRKICGIVTEDAALLEKKFETGSRHKYQDGCRGARRKLGLMWNACLACWSATIGLADVEHEGHPRRQ